MLRWWKMSKVKLFLEAMDLSSMTEEDLKEVLSDLDYKIREINSLRLKRKKDKKEQLLKDTSFKYPSFAFDDDEVAVNGSVTFSSQEQAQDFVKTMGESWDNQYRLDWQGEGDYDIIPTMETDRCSDTIFVSTMKKRGSYEVV